MSLKLITLSKREIIMSRSEESLTVNSSGDRITLLSKILKGGGVTNFRKVTRHATSFAPNN